MQTSKHGHNPFLPFRARFPPRTSDDEYVDKIARSMEQWDRWRWAAVFFHVAIVGGILWLCFNVVELLNSFQNALPVQNQNAMPDEVVMLGIILGMKVGMLLHGSVTEVINGLKGFRTERLLVQYRADRLGGLPVDHGNMLVTPEAWHDEATKSSLAQVGVKPISG